MINKNNIFSKTSGFTIVELLIVIVVIGILAAISIVAYNGIQTRSQNTMHIQTVQQFHKLVTAASVDDANLGLTIGTWSRWCPTDQGDEMVSGNPRCGQYSGTTQAAANTVTHSSALITALKSNSSALPKVTKTTTGTTHFYNPVLVTGRFTDSNGTSFNAMLNYWLKGTNIGCGLSNSVKTITSSGTAPNETYPIGLGSSSD